ncbi:MAG: GntR family transcriptional repressor for pyruvate dehydrogenase complex [Sulfitobacter sp.]|jgi:GntR family transcriptional repressor for pyruvate dehydrogenase complex
MPTNSPTSPNRSKVEDITAILRDEILRGQYRPGERLPSERDLAARFETSRGGIREALKKLEQLGIAIITPGGVRVVPVEEASLSVLGHLVDLQEVPDPEMIGHLFEVLGALISMAARTAIDRATPAELQQMQDIVMHLADHPENAEQQHQGWRELGTLFAQVSNNLVLRLILNGLKTHFINRLEVRPELEVEVDFEQQKDTLNKLSNGLATRDSRRVASTIIEHFDVINARIQGALNLNPIASNPIPSKPQSTNPNASFTHE